MSAPVWRRRGDVEGIKARGELEPDFDRIVREGYESITPEDYYRLKTHGVCSQNVAGAHMIRIRIPGGVASASQLECVAALAESCGDGTVHLTTRTNLELHRVPTASLLQVMEELHTAGLSTRVSCGHTVRNVLGCPAAGICEQEVLDTRPAVGAVHDLVIAKAAEHASRLPRRLNISFGGCGECGRHAQVNDIGFVAAAVPGRGPGFAVWIAGSLGTNPRFSHPLCAWIAEQDAPAAVEAVIDLYAQHAFRDKPAKMRLKYLVEEWGIERFRDEFTQRFEALTGRTPVFGEPSMPPEPADGAEASVLAQRQPGYFRVRVRVPIGDATPAQVRALARLCAEEGSGFVHFTPEQNAEIPWVAEPRIARVLAELASSGLTSFGSGDVSDVRACPGTTHCVLAAADSQGAGRRIGDAFRASPPADPAVRRLRVHISGCPNSCAQHQVADIGLAGCKTKIEGQIREGYQVYVGGRLGSRVRAGNRIGRVDARFCKDTVLELTELYKRERRDGEAMADVVERLGPQAVAERLAARLPAEAGNFLFEPDADE